MRITLNGLWFVHEGPGPRHYRRTAPVPGLAGDPSTPQKGTLWYQREVRLPRGSWTHATLILNGARFCPSVWVDGELVSEAPGGMAPTLHPLRNDKVRPEAAISLEIALHSLESVEADDASYIPPADRPYTNVSSGLWDSVFLCLHGHFRIARLLPSWNQTENRLDVRWEFTPSDRLAEQEAKGFSSDLSRFEMELQVLDPHERVLAATVADVGGFRGITCMELPESCRPWSPEDPVLYTLRAELRDGGKSLDIDERILGLRDFRVEGDIPILNGEPLVFRGGCMAWHRFCRIPEAGEQAFDSEWLERHVIRELKIRGADSLRFQSGMPPEALLELCDLHGLMVQVEWLSTQSIQANEESLIEQWRQWMDLCLAHPSVLVITPWIEDGMTDGQFVLASSALMALLEEYDSLPLFHKRSLSLLSGCSWG